MKINWKKYKKFLVLGILLVVLVGCKRVVDPNTNQVMEKYIIRLGDAFPWGKEGYGWFDIFIVWPIAQVFNFVAKYVGAFWSIIIVTILIDVLKLSSTIKSTTQQQKMQALQPDVARIKEKYRGRDDRQSKMQESMEIQKLYEKNEINMMGSMVPMLIQLPIIIAVYQAVQRADLIIHGSLLGHPFLGTPKEGFATGNMVYITIFLVMVVAQALSLFLPQYLQKRKARNSKRNVPAAGNAQGQGMMIFSLGMITLLAFSWNVGMSIYWGISSITRLTQTLFIQWKYVDKK